MTGNGTDDSGPRVAIFWDESYLWGLIAFWAFYAEGVDFDLLSGEDIRAGRLDAFDVLFIPGGWASDKINALGGEGVEAVRGFIHAGGGYLGFCGGAGLALTHDSGLGLVPVGRLPTSKRLPSFSGTIRLNYRDVAHSAWEGLKDGQAYHAWWPGQFSLTGDEDVTVLADYGEPDMDAFVTDLPVRDDMDWHRWEESYGINLDPGRIVGEPALLEATYGKGRVLLSYIHFETPGDMPGRRVLLNMLGYLAIPGRNNEAGGKQDHNNGAGGEQAAVGSGDKSDSGDTSESGATSGRAGMPDPPPVELDADAAATALSLAREAMRFDRFGIQNLLWYRRRDWLMQWRRGIRGIEYSTLDTMLREIANHAEFAQGLDELSNKAVRELAGLVGEFYADASQLLMLERLAMTRGPLSPLKCDDPDIRELRGDLFSTDQRCGGRYRQIVEVADSILLNQLRRRIAGR